MSRSARTALVIVVATVMASIATYGVYLAVSRIPVREVEVASTKIVVAVGTLPTGTQLQDKDLKLVAWPESSPVPGSFTKFEDVVRRGLVAGVVENEPITESKLAPLASGAGLPPTIPPGMRAMSVRVDDVVGVAGFVVPGTRVDVVVTMISAASQDKPMSRTVLGNVLVLTSGTRIDQEQGRKGEAQPTTVVTLAVTPDDAERVALASNNGRISLALRNPLDVDPTQTSGVKLDALMAGPGGPPAPAAPPKRVARPVAPPPPAPVVAPAPKQYVVETIRAAQRKEETLR
jgi:pilus assembly protein CpaB